ncbi:MAG TPA: hypothetical protein VGK74_18320 [Symbiobacteriaceae bacterium]|jgi:hypothetical protein
MNPSNPPRRITSKPLTRGDLHRDPSGAKVMPSGNVRANANGCDDFDELALAKALDVKNYSAGLGVDEAKRLIYIYAEKPETTGCVGIHRGAKREYSFSVATVFAEAPALRVNTRRQCPLVSGTDSHGEPCLILSLDSALDKPVRTKKTGDTTK